MVYCLPPCDWLVALHPLRQKLQVPWVNEFRFWINLFVDWLLSNQSQIIATIFMCQVIRCWHTHHSYNISLEKDIANRSVWLFESLKFRIIATSYYEILIYHRLLAIDLLTWGRGRLIRHCVFMPETIKCCYVCQKRSRSLFRGDNTYYLYFDQTAPTILISKCISFIYYGNWYLRIDSRYRCLFRLAKKHATHRPSNLTLLQ